VKFRWHVQDSTDEYLRIYCRFMDFVPGDEWTEKFMHDHPLSLLKPSSLERCRADAAADPHLIYGFYSLLRREMNRLALHDKPEQVFNLDESAFFVDPSRVKVVSATGASDVHRITTGPGRQCFTVMACVSAAGGALPPLVVFPAKNLHSTWHGTSGIAIAGTTYACSLSGWMTTEIFTDWFTQSFLPRVPKRPALLIFDGHKTHLGLSFINRAQSENVAVIKLPSHTTNRLQPQDASCFRPLKNCWEKNDSSTAREWIQKVFKE
jgi:hypothetical protein